MPSLLYLLLRGLSSTRYSHWHGRGTITRRGAGLPRPKTVYCQARAGQAHAPTGFRWISPARMENPFDSLLATRFVRVVQCQWRAYQRFQAGSWPTRFWQGRSFAHGRLWQDRNVVGTAWHITGCAVFTFSHRTRINDSRYLLPSWRSSNDKEGLICESGSYGRWRRIEATPINDQASQADGSPRR